VAILKFLLRLSEGTASPMASVGRRLHLFMASSNPRSAPEVGKAKSPPRSPEHAFGYLNPTSPTVCCEYSAWVSP